MIGISWEGREHASISIPTQTFGLHVGVVNIPPANARHGLLSWAALRMRTEARTSARRHSSRGARSALASWQRARATRNLR